MKLLVSRLGNSDHDLSISEGPRLRPLRLVHHAVQGFAWHPEAVNSPWIRREETPRLLRRMQT
jgi:hypothetical protein